MDTPPLVFVEQNEIEGFSELTAEFLNRVLGLDASQATVSDISDLSDFCFSGDFPVGTLSDSATHKENVAAWDAWVLSVVKREYGLTLATPCINLVTLFTQIAAQRQPRVLH